MGESLHSRQISDRVTDVEASDSLVRRGAPAPITGHRAWTIAPKRSRECASSAGCEPPPPLGASIAQSSIQGSHGPWPRRTALICGVAAPDPPSVHSGPGLRVARISVLTTTWRTSSVSRMWAATGACYVPMTPDVCVVPSACRVAVDAPMGIATHSQLDASSLASPSPSPATPDGRRAARSTTPARHRHSDACAPVRSPPITSRTLIPVSFTTPTVTSLTPSGPPAARDLVPVAPGAMERERR